MEEKKFLKKKDQLRVLRIIKRLIIKKKIKKYLKLLKENNLL